MTTTGTMPTPTPAEHARIKALTHCVRLAEELGLYAVVHAIHRVRGGLICGDAWDPDEVTTIADMLTPGEAHLPLHAALWAVAEW